MKKTILNFEKIDAILKEVFENAKLENLNKIDEDTYTERVNKVIPDLENLGYHVPKQFAFYMMYDANDYNMAKDMQEGSMFLNRFTHDLRFDYECKVEDISQIRDIKELSIFYMKTAIYSNACQISSNKFDEISSQIKNRLKKLGYKTSAKSEKKICDLSEKILKEVGFYNDDDKDRPISFRIALNKIDDYAPEIKSILRQMHSQDLSR